MRPDKGIDVNAATHTALKNNDKDGWTYPYVLVEVARTISSRQAPSSTGVSWVLHGLTLRVTRLPRVLASWLWHYARGACDNATFSWLC
jgi:hypothetical protein